MVYFNFILNSITNRPKLWITNRCYFVSHLRRNGQPWPLLLYCVAKASDGRHMLWTRSLYGLVDLPLMFMTWRQYFISQADYSRYEKLISFWNGMKAVRNTIKKENITKFLSDYFIAVFKTVFSDSPSSLAKFCFLVVLHIFRLRENNLYMLPIF